MKVINYKVIGRDDRRNRARLGSNGKKSVSAHIRKLLLPLDWSPWSWTCQPFTEGSAGTTEQTQKPALLNLLLKTPQRPTKPETFCMGCCLAITPMDIAVAESITRKNENFSFSSHLLISLQGLHLHAYLRNVIWSFELLCHRGQDRGDNGAESKQNSIWMSECKNGNNWIL